MSDVFIPFNKDPVSIARKTGSYTIPTGSYALVLGRCVDGGDLTVDGDSWLNTNPSSIAITHISGTTPAASDTDLFTMSTPRSAVVDLTLNIVGGAGILIEVSVKRKGLTTIEHIVMSETTAGVFLYQDLKLSDGDIIRVQGSGLDEFNLAITGWYTDSTSNINIGQIWAPEGSVLNATGFAFYTVMLFNKYA